MTVCKKATVQSIIESRLVISDSIKNTVDSSSIQDSLYNLSNSLLFQGEESLSQAVALICHLSSMQLQFDESENPYRSVSFGSFISVNLSDLTGEHLRIIVTPHPLICNIALQSTHNGLKRGVSFVFHGFNIA